MKKQIKKVKNVKLPKYSVSPQTKKAYAKNEKMIERLKREENISS
ncbi:hypothetical protein [Alkalihalobacterium alkalinitrilicum]|nr:hypothetical protein [Alkalihalobacterium alkalinitrilicum]